MALDSETPEVMRELEGLRCDLQKMTRVREEAEAIIQGKESELQIVTSHLREVEELLKRSEDCQKKLENNIRLTLEILENANRPPAVQCSTILFEREKKLGRASRKLRKPHTPFLLWCKDKRNEVCDAHPTASIADVFAIMLKEWDTVSVEDKNHYMELHSALREKYLLKVDSQGKSSETDQAQTKSSDEDNIKQKAMSLLGQYLASKKAQITQSRVEVNPETSASSTSADVSSAAGQARSSFQALPIKHSVKALPEAAEVKTTITTVGNDSDEVHEDAQSSTQQELLGNHLDMVKQNPSAYLLFSMEKRKTLSLNEPEMTHIQMNASIAKLWRELSPEEKRSWHETAIAVQKTENADQKIPLCIPAGLKLEKCPEVSGNENCPKVPSWILEKSMFRKAEDDRKIGIPEPVSDHRILEHLRSLPVNTFIV